jgi:hypothetical protein
MAERRGTSAVRITAPDGSDPHWLGEYGHVGNLQYSHSYPGGPSTMQCVLDRPPSYRVASMSPGRRVQVCRGASIVWQGVLDEPQPAENAWTITGTGIGSLGNDFCDVWSTWRDPNDHLNQAIGRGLPWKNPGISTTGIWLGDQQDSGSEQITDYLTESTVQGIVSWSVDARDGTFTTAPIPTVADRLLVCTAPVARTVADDINRMFIKYQITNDDSGSATVAPTTATYGVAVAESTADIALHGPREFYYDLTANGIMAESDVIQNGQNILARYNRASFGGTFSARQGQLLNLGGYPVDLGSQKAGFVARLLLANLGYGGEVSAVPVTVLAGAYTYYDSTQTAEISPFQRVASSLQDLLASVFPTRSSVS